jgi:hypothetical protein
MKAVLVHEYGAPEVLKFEEYPDPVPGQGEVLVWPTSSAQRAGSFSNALRPFSAISS